MASYEELYEVSTESALRNKIAVAVVIYAQTLLDKTTPSQDELTWALSAIQAPANKAREMMFYVLAANKDATQDGIRTAQDSAIQTSVEKAAAALIKGGKV